MSWLFYLLEANLYLVLFYGFYRLFLYNETFYNLNRYFLLISTLISFLLPTLQLGFLKPSHYQIHGDIMYEVPPPPVEPVDVANNSNLFADVNWFYVFYLLIAFGFAVKLSFSIYNIIKIWVKAKKRVAGDITLVEVNGESTAFSFFNLLFIHPALANQPAVLKHEMVHIKQKHSFDVVFFELVQIICWFNPILYFIKKDIKLLHEYIADELTTNNDVQKHEYALFLIQNSFGLRAQPITNQIFNQSILKRRINMLNKKRTAGGARLRLLLALPLTGGMLCMSTMAFTKDYGYVDLLPEKSEFIIPIQDVPKVNKDKKGNTATAPAAKKDQIKFPPPIVKRDQVKFASVYKPKRQDAYIVKYSVNPSNDNRIKVDKKYIVVNGKPIENQDKFYGATQTESVTILNGVEATKRYGENGKFGVVEITGSNIKYLDEMVIVPPPPKIDVVKFPPPIVRYEQKYFTPNFKKDKETGDLIGLDKRYIVVNGTPIEDNSKFYGVTQSESVIYLSPAQATKVYGEKGRYGAVEIKGDNVQFNTKEDQIKFPPPIVRPDVPKKMVKFPPPIVRPAPPTPKFKNKKITPPPPPVDPTAKSVDGIKTPPPPVEPPPPRKRKNIPAPPPPVDPAKKTLNLKLKAVEPTSLKAKASRVDDQIKKEIKRQINLQRDAQKEINLKLKEEVKQGT